MTRTTAVLYLVDSRLEKCQQEIQRMANECKLLDVDFILLDLNWLMESNGMDLYRQISSRINITVDFPISRFTNIRQWLAHITAWASVSRLPETITSVIVLEYGQILKLDIALKILTLSPVVTAPTVCAFGHVSLPTTLPSSDKICASVGTTEETKSGLVCGQCKCLDFEGTECGGKPCQGTVRKVDPLVKSFPNEYMRMQVTQDCRDIGLCGYGISRTTAQHLMNKVVVQILKNMWLLNQPLQWNLEWCDLDVVLVRDERIIPVVESTELILGHTIVLCGGLVTLASDFLGMVFDPRSHLKWTVEHLALSQQVPFLKSFALPKYHAQSGLYERLAQVALHLDLSSQEKQLFFMYWWNQAMNAWGSIHRLLALWHAAHWYNNCGSGDMAWMCLQEIKDEEPRPWGSDLQRFSPLQADVDYHELTRFEFVYELIRACRSSLFPQRRQHVGSLCRQLAVVTNLSEEQSLRLDRVLRDVRPCVTSRHAWMEWYPSATALSKSIAIVGATLGSSTPSDVFNFVHTLVNLGWSVTVFTNEQTPSSSSTILSNPRIVYPQSAIDESIETQGKYDVCVIFQASQLDDGVLNNISGLKWCERWYVMSHEANDIKHMANRVPNGWFVGDSEMVEKCPLPSSNVWVLNSSSTLTTTPHPKKISLSCFSPCECCHDDDRRLVEKFNTLHPEHRVHHLESAAQADFALHSGLPLGEKCRKAILEAQEQGAVPIVLDHVDWQQSILAGFRCNFGFEVDHQQKWMVVLKEIMSKSSDSLQSKVRESIQIAVHRRKEWKSVLHEWTTQVLSYSKSVI